MDQKVDYKQNKKEAKNKKTVGSENFRK
jgi:hypothetical protein